MSATKWLSVTLIGHDPVIATLQRQDDWWPELFDAVFDVVSEGYNFVDVEEEIKTHPGRVLFQSIALLCYGVEVDTFYRSRQDPLDVADRNQRRELINQALVAKKFIGIPRRAHYPRFIPEGRVAPLTVMWDEIQ